MTSTYENVFMLIVAQLHNNDGANDVPCRIYHNNKEPTSSTLIELDVAHFGG